MTSPSRMAALHGSISAAGPIGQYFAVLMAGFRIETHAALIDDDLRPKAVELDLVNPPLTLGRLLDQRGDLRRMNSSRPPLSRLLHGYLLSRGRRRRSRMIGTGDSHYLEPAACAHPTQAIASIYIPGRVVVILASSNLSRDI